MANPIYSCLWFDGQAIDAAYHYCKIFDDSRIISESPMVVIFELNGTRYMGLNGGPQYKFTPAVSYVIECETQEEIDYYWEKLGESGNYDQCGWLTDKFGVSWQVVPAILSQLMSDPDRAPRVATAFMKMGKFDIEALKSA